MEENCAEGRACTVVRSDLVAAEKKGRQAWLPLGPRRQWEKANGWPRTARIDKGVRTVRLRDQEVQRANPGKQDVEDDNYGVIVRRASEWARGGRSRGRGLTAASFLSCPRRRM